ncbi:MAG TPA: TonB-dependent receptor [Cyclobacteriaceae bacterium]|nr:TonB-dependent receptor [Cyclobacteriaceae bacterium]
MRKLYKKLSLTALLALLVASIALGQERVVSGTVTDQEGSSMPGVNVLVKGTSTGTATDANGQFRVSVSSDQAVLVVSFIGYMTQEVAVGSQSTINISLAQDVQTLTEVVVTGYGVDKRRELTGAVATVKSKDLTFAPTGNVEQMLQGRVPGVTVITNGQPGTTSQIRIRGFGGFGGNAPLYIVDGLPTYDISFLNPDDIESTTVLKDAASASIYGARAASGVIIDTTRKGRKGQKLNVTYDNMIGATFAGKGQDMMNPTDFADWTWRAVRNTEDARARSAKETPDYAKAITTYNHPQFGTGASPRIPDFINVGGTPGVVGSVDLNAEKAKYNIDPRNGSIYQVVRANKEGTDWYREITRTAPVVRQTLGFSGGGESHRFYVGMSMQDQKGILLSNSLKRYALRVNTEFDVLPKLRIGENFQMTYIERLGVTGAEGGQGIANDENDILQAFRMPSIIPVYDEFGGYAGTAAKGFNNPRNPVANQKGLLDNRNFGTGGIANFYAEYDVIPGLTLRTSIGGFYGASFSRGYTRWQYENSENNSAFQFNQNQGYNFSWTFTNTATFKKTFDSHSIEALVGQEALNDGAGWGYGQSGLNPFVWDTKFITMTNTTQNPPNSNTFFGSNYSSYFGNIKYSFKEKYIIGAVLRRDGSSRFGPNERYGVFPAASVAWRVSSESFMQALPWVADLKIRGGYGAMGNSAGLSSINQYTLYSGDRGNSSYDIGGSNNQATVGYFRSRIGNLDAKWESSVTSNIGIDGLFFDGKLDIVADLWKKESKDLLLVLPIPTVAGGATPPAQNVGKMVNQGIDIGITNKGNIVGDLSYEVNLNGSFLKNEITEIKDDLTYLNTINPSYRGLTPIRNQLGHSISSFYGYQVEGLFQSAEEVAAAPAQPGKDIGRFRFKDVDGNGTIDADDRTYLGSPVPKFTGGLTITLRYKGFDFSTYAYSSIGNKIFNASKWFTDFFPSFQGAAISNRVKESWSPTNTGATIPIFESASNFSTNSQANSFYVEDGSFVRMQNLTVGYTLPNALLAKAKMTKLRVYVTGNNLFTITKYEGLDPGVGGNADTQFGIDVGNYPVTKGFVAGINIGF